MPHEPSKCSTLLICISISFSPSVSVCGLKRPVSISVPFSGYDTIPNIVLVGIFHSWNVSVDIWKSHQQENEWTISLVMKGKTKRCWIGYLKAVIWMLILWSAEPRQLSHRVFMLSASAVIRLPHLAPVSPGFWQQCSAPSISLTHSTHSYIWLALTWSPRWRSIQPLPKKILVKRM